MNKTKFLLLALAAIIIFSFVAVWIFNYATGSLPYTGSWETKRDRAEILAACRQHVREADRKAAESIAKHAAKISAFIQSRKAGAEPFSGDMVSMYGRWRVAKSRLPLTDKDGHKKYVEEKFGQHIFTNAALGSQMKLAIESSIKDIEGIENELAAAVRQEVLGESRAPGEIPIASDEFKKAVERLVDAAQWDGAKSVGSLVVSEVAAQVGTQVMVRLGVSTGILTTAAATSWWTFGGAAVIGLAVDWVWAWIDDPAGDIEREVKNALDTLSLNASKAFREEMTGVAFKRSEYWMKAVEDIVP